MPDLPITVTKQEKSNWCYSAVSQAVLNYYGKSMTQETIAKWSVAQDDKLTGRKTTDLNCPQDPLYILEEKGLSASVAPSLEKGATDDAIRTAIDAGRPVIALVNQGPINHYILIKGYHIVGSGRRAAVMLHILDPYNPDPPIQVNALEFLQKPDFRGLLFLTTPPPKRGGRSHRIKRRRTRRRHTLRMNSH